MTLYLLFEGGDRLRSVAGDLGQEAGHEKHDQTPNF